MFTKGLIGALHGAAAVLFSAFRPRRQEFEQARARAAEIRQAGHAIAARYDRKHGRVVVALHNGVELAVPVGLVEGLAGAAPDDLADIEVTPAGLGPHWPKLDADVYVPALMQGVGVSRR